MKEIKDIIQAYDTANATCKKTALATVVKVDGSAYRRPGARMLITEDGGLTGAISGGCLEGDALRKAQLVIFQEKSMVVTYDTTDDDDQKFGVGLGCNGIIQVLIEPIDPLNENNAIMLLKECRKTRKNAVLITAFSLRNAREEQIGTRLLYLDADNTFGNIGSDDLFNKVHEEIPYLFEIKSNIIKEYADLDDLNIFFEWVKPAVQLMLFGAGNDTIPLVRLAAVLGWEITVLDGRKSYATKERFPQANRIVVGKAEEVVNKIEMDHNTVVLLMTHNFDYEAVVLENIHTYSLPYIGILGPKKKTEKLLDKLLNKGIDLTGCLETNLFAPIGLDIGSESPEEIALSILAEVQAVINKKEPIFLRDKKGPIHQEERNLNEESRK